MPQTGGTGALPAFDASKCGSLGALAGTEGDAATQTMAVRVQGPAWIYLDVTTNIPTGDDGKVTLTGERSANESPN